MDNDNSKDCNKQSIDQIDAAFRCASGTVLYMHEGHYPLVGGSYHGVMIHLESPISGVALSKREAKRGYGKLWSKGDLSAEPHNAFDKGSDELELYLLRELIQPLTGQRIWVYSIKSYIEPPMDLAALFKSFERAGLV